MGKYQLGEFEEIVLLTVGVLYDEAYGIAIKKEIEQQLDRKVSVGAMQSALRRMEQKGYVKSRQGEVNSVRGGRPKRYFTITAQGKQALEYSRDIRTKLWNQIPKTAFEI
ncbi:MAG: PadR family transcriptional regulator [Bacteroidota bacterium]